MNLVESSSILTIIECRDGIEVVVVVCVEVDDVEFVTTSTRLRSSEDNSDAGFDGKIEVSSSIGKPELLAIESKSCLTFLLGVSRVTILSDSFSTVLFVLTAFFRFVDITMEEKREKRKKMLK